MKRTDYWPPERERKLVELAPSVQQVNDLAVALNVSKNAVIGKLARMRRHGAVIETNFRHVPRVGKSGLAERPKPPMLPKPRRELPPPDPVRPEPERMRRLTLMQLGHRTCRWPIGDVGEPGFCFCGNLTDGRSYCPMHHRMAHGR